MNPALKSFFVQKGVSYTRVITVDFASVCSCRFMPMLKYIIQNAVQHELRLLRGKTIECVSLIGLAVGRDKFLADCSEVMQLLLKSQTQEAQDETADDDPQVNRSLPDKSTEAANNSSATFAPSRWSKKKKKRIDHSPITIELLHKEEQSFSFHLPSRSHLLFHAWRNSFWFGGGAPVSFLKS